MKEEQYKYTKEHEWVSLEGDQGTLGITDYAQDQLGDIVYVELPDIGLNVQQGKEMGSIESVKAVADIYAPLSGEIAEVNETLQDTPENLNKDPYGEGWIAKVKIANREELSSLMDHATYMKFVEEESAK
jgi:glycine cleavage system H protein